MAETVTGTAVVSLGPQRVCANACAAPDAKENHMGRISTYMQVSLDGYFAGPDGEIDWFKNTEPDPDFDAYSLERARGGSVLLFGRTTYEMMSSAWPSDEAHEDQP